MIHPLFQRDPRLRMFGGRVGAEAGVDRHPEAALEADIDSTFRLGALLRLQRHWRSGREDDAGIAASTWRLFENHDTRMRAELGLRWYRGDEGSGAGPLGGASLELFPHRPWVLSLDGDLGTVGSRVVATGAVAAGLLTRAVELRAGLRLQSSRPAFHGPFIGLRYWF